LRSPIVTRHIYRFKIHLPATIYTRVAEKSMEIYDHMGAGGNDLAP
jgi:hypothetical protein